MATAAELPSIIGILGAPAVALVAWLIIAIQWLPVISPQMNRAALAHLSAHPPAEI